MPLWLTKFTISSESSSKLFLLISPSSSLTRISHIDFVRIFHPHCYSWGVSWSNSTRENGSTMANHDLIPKLRSRVLTLQCLIHAPGPGLGCWPIFFMPSHGRRKKDSRVHFPNVLIQLGYFIMTVHCAERVNQMIIHHFVVRALSTILVYDISATRAIWCTF